MTRFRFRLQTVLRLREQEENLAKLVLGKATRRCDEIKLGIINAQSELVGLRISAFDIFALQARDAYQQRLHQRISRLETDLVGAEAVRQEALGKYNLRRQAAEILRKLRQRKWEEYHLDNIRMEDIEQDDMVASHHVPA